jgi:site-specific recombinase XerD
MTEYLDVVCERLVLSEKMAPRTLADYRSKTRNWIVPLLGKHRLDRLTPEHLDAAYMLMLERDLSPSTVLKIHRILSRALKIAERRGRISRNVATLVDAPAVAPNEIEPLTREEARRILDVAANKRNGARWSVALFLAYGKEKPLVSAGRMWTWKPV